MADQAHPYDALLLMSFGGPEGPDDVVPFLENVTRGRGIPRARLEEVGKHYDQFGGVSPINEQNRALITALEAELAAHAIDLPVYFGNRNWHPMIGDTMQRMADDGVTRALAIFTSTYSCYSGCRQYRENIAAAREGVEGAPIVDKVRHFYDHPGYIDAIVDRVKTAFAELPDAVRDDARIAFTAHSIPVSMASGAHYEKQLRETARLVAERVGNPEWELVFQSRSGPPQIPWLEPDICDHIESLGEKGAAAVVISPIGFVSDHLEVLYDLDHEAREAAAGAGVAFARAGTPGTHPSYVAALRELVQERLDPGRERRALGTLGPSWDVCPAGCCPYTPRRPTRPGG